MNKTELVAAIAEKAGLSKKDAAGVLTTSFKALPALNFGALEAGILIASPV